MIPDEFQDLIRVIDHAFQLLEKVESISEINGTMSLTHTTVLQSQK